MSGAGRRLAIISSQAFSVINFRGPLIGEMVRRQVTVYALAPDYDEASRARVRALGAVPVDSAMARAGMNPLRDLADMLRLARLLRGLRLDATFSYFIKPVIYGTLAARLAGVPDRTVMIEGAGYVFCEPGTPSAKRRVLRAVVVRLYALALSQARRVFMLNRDDRALFTGLGMVDGAKVTLIDGIGLDLAQFPPAPPVATPVCFLLVARLLREKGVNEYIAAARAVKRRHPGVRFLLLGDVDQNPGSVSVAEVEAWVAEGLVEWPGHVSSVAPWIAQASVFVLPSWGEGLPRSTQEAMAMGRAVITTDVPGCRETVIDGVNGFMVPVRDSAALEQAMLRFVAEPDLIAAMGAHSRRIAEQRYDVHQINDTILKGMGIHE